MRKLALGIAIALVAVACNKASDKDVDQLIDDTRSVFEGYFKTLQDNKADPKKAVEEGQKYIDANQDKIAKINKVFNKRGSQAQIDKAKAAMEEIGEMIRTEGEKAGEIFAGDMESAQKAQAQLTGLAEAMTKENK